MPDLPSVLPSAELEESFLRVVDVEGKIPAALEALGPIVDRDVVVLDGGRGALARRLAALGARTLSLAFAADMDAALAAVASLASCSADVVVIPWSELAYPGSPLIGAADRLLRPCGRLLVIHDYGRDGVWGLRADLQPRQVEWSHRKGPFLGAGFRVRVIHSWWTFESSEQAVEMLAAPFGRAGMDLAEQMKHLRLEYQVAIYHRTVAAPASVNAAVGTMPLVVLASDPASDLFPELVAE